MTSQPLFKRLLHYIESDLQRGDKLPGERELADRFGVGRNQVREELSKLEAYQVVRLQPKKRAVVTRASGSLDRLALRTQAGGEINELQASQAIEVRRINEIAAVRLACERATLENLEAMADVLSRSEAKLEAGESIHEEDEAFHLEIVRATQNYVLLSTLRSFYVLTRQHRSRFFSSAQRGLASHQEHVKLYKALMDRDAERAVALMDSHLQHAGAFWSGSRN